MTTCCDLYLHFGGKWILMPTRHYIGGNVDIEFKFDIDFLSYKDIKDRYIDDLGCKDIQHLYYLELRKSLSDGLMLVEGDKYIRSIMGHVTEGRGTEVHIYPFEVNDIPFYEHEKSIQPNSHVKSNRDNRTNDEIVEIFTQSSAATMLDELDEIEASQVDGNIEIHTEYRAEWNSIEIREAYEGHGGNEGSDDNEEDYDNEKYESDEAGVINNLMGNEAAIKRLCLNKKFTFELGQTFANAKAFPLAVSKYSVQEGCPLKVIKSDKNRVRYHCEPTCSFKLYAVKDGNCDEFVVRTFVPSHECTRQYTNPRATKLFLAEYFKEKIRGKPEYSIRDMKDHAKEALELEVTPSMCKTAKRAIIQELDGGYKEEYSCLEAYVNELITSNPGSTFDLQFSKEGLRIGKRIFCRLYLCFDACRKGWMDGCRPIIGLDGCFLKDICKGQLLVAVGHDAMDQIYPIAWAVVEKETKANWEWFLSHLIEDLKLQDGANVTLMSDMQKGLLLAVSMLLPRAEYKWCARHVLSNWGIKFKGLELQKHFWSCAWSTYEKEFNDNLKTLADVNKKAAEYLLKYPPQHWCRAYFTDRCKDPMVDNNITESFNSWILEQRSRPILRMLEELRVMIMNRLHENEKKATSWSGDYSPTSMQEFMLNHSIARYCRVVFNGEKGYEVTHGTDRHCVILLERKCICRAWQLSGIPCPHAICAMYHAEINPVKQIDLYYSKLRYMMTYKYKMQPGRGKHFWRMEDFEPIEPPKITRMPDRPKKTRIREASEGNVGERTGTGLSRKGQIQKCSNCGQTGHKRTYCKAPQGEKYAHLNEENDSNVHQHHKRKRDQGISSGHPSWIKPRIQVRVVGIGYFYDENSGTATLNPGNTSETLLFDGVEDIEGLHNSDPVVTFPIPNERQLKQKKMKPFKPPIGTRSISFIANDSEVSQPSDLPFQPLKLQWKGKKAMTSKQLHEEKELCIGKKKDKEIHIG
ncbi:uncharacterized protein [Euphorbia lathyris]|uniref:uncharacterized protein n=1 Tax=Euphorbia lathyris TaxID=212925 RepID=UPI00331332BD